MEHEKKQQELHFALLLWFPVSVVAHETKQHALYAQATTWSSVARPTQCISSSKTICLELRPVVTVVAVVSGIQACTCSLDGSKHEAGKLVARDVRWIAMVTTLNDILRNCHQERHHLDFLYTSSALVIHVIVLKRSFEPRLQIVGHETRWVSLTLLPDGLRPLAS